MHPLAPKEGREGIDTGGWDWGLRKKTQTNKNKRKRQGTNKKKGLSSKADILTQLNITAQNHFVDLQANRATPSTLEEQPEITGTAQSSLQIRKLTTSSPKKRWWVIVVGDSI